MVEPEVTRTWTKEYVTENRRKCLSFLQATNLLAVRYIEKRRYASAVTSLDQLLNGLEVMHNSRQYGDLRSHMSFLSFVEGVIMAFASPSAMMREAVELGRAVKYTPEQVRDNGLVIARGLVEDARDFARSDEMKQTFGPLLEALEQGDAAVQRFRDEEFPDHPEELLAMYRNFNTRMFDPLIEKGASSVPLPPPDRRGGADLREETAREKKKRKKAPRLRAYPPERFPTFGDWAAANGWDEEDLARVYKRVRFRRNLYAVLSCTPLLLLFFAFFVRANDLAEMIRTRNLNAKGRYPAPLAVLLGVFMLFWLVIPPLIVSFILALIIGATNWGMGLGDRRDRPSGTAAAASPAASSAPSPARSSGDGAGKVVLAVVLLGLVLAGICWFFFAAAPSPVTGLFPQAPAGTPEEKEPSPGPGSAPDSPKEEEAPESRPEGRLDGVTWVSVRRERDAVRVESYRFEDGAVTYHVTPYQNAQLEPLGEETGWYVLPMGHPDYYGGYRVEEEDLVVIIRGNTYQPEAEEPARILALDWDDEGNLLLDGRTFLPDADPNDLEALCARLGVNLSVE